MSEKLAYATLRKNLLQGYDRIDRLENLVGTGMPDVNYCSRGVECWIEIKCPKIPKRPKTPLFGSNHKLSQAQKNWFLRQAQAEGNAWILIACDTHWFLVDGKYADLLNLADVKTIGTWSEWESPVPISAKKWQDLRESLQWVNQYEQD